jgi:hypothetical protein
MEYMILTLNVILSILFAYLQNFILLNRKSKQLKHN